MGPGGLGQIKQVRTIEYHAAACSSVHMFILTTHARHACGRTYIMEEWDELV